jgi:hypothetical protein
MPRRGATAERVECGETDCGPATGGSLDSFSISDRFCLYGAPQMLRVCLAHALCGPALPTAIDRCCWNTAA